MLPKQQKTVPYLLAAHRFRAGRALMALHSDIPNQLTRDFHNTSAESSSLQQIKIEHLWWSKATAQTISWDFHLGKEIFTGSYQSNSKTTKLKEDSTPHEYLEQPAARPFYSGGI